MIEKGVDIEEVVYTITKTLPVCKVRDIAYATFTIIQIFNDGRTKIVTTIIRELLFLKMGRFIKLTIPKYY